MRVSTCTCVWRYPDVFIESKQTVHRGWGKEISPNLPGFVCFSPFVLPYPHSLYLTKCSSAVSFPFLSLSSASLVHRFSLFRLPPRPAGNRYYPIAISLARPAFFRVLSRSRSDGAIAQMLTRPELRDRLGYPRQVRTYLCYIYNWKLYPTDEINRSRRLLRHAFDLSRVDPLRLSLILWKNHSLSRIDCHFHYDVYIVYIRSSSYLQ